MLFNLYNTLNSLWDDKKFIHFLSIIKYSIKNIKIFLFLLKTWVQIISEKCKSHPKMDFWANLSALSFYVLAIIISVFLLLLTLLYASEQFRKLWFSWFYTIFCTPLIKRGGNAIRAKLFEKLSRIEPSGISKQLVIHF